MVRRISQAIPGPAGLGPGVRDCLVAASVIVVMMAVQWLTVSFGRIGRFAEVEMLAEDAPPGLTSQVVVLVPDPSTKPRLAHTQIYNRPETIKAIADWVKTIVEPTETRVGCQNLVVPEDSMLLRSG